MNKSTIVIEIVRTYLQKNSYDGLCNVECGCFLDDLMPCSEPQSDCEAGYRIPAPPDYPYGPGDIISTKKPEKNND